MLQISRPSLFVVHNTVGRLRLRYYTAWRWDAPTPGIQVQTSSRTAPCRTVEPTPRATTTPLTRAARTSTRTRTGRGTRTTETGTAGTSLRRTGRRARAARLTRLRTTTMRQLPIIQLATMPKNSNIAGNFNNHKEMKTWISL